MTKMTLAERTNAIFSEFYPRKLIGQEQTHDKVQSKISILLKAEEAQRKELVKRLKKIEDKLSLWCAPVRKLSDLGRESDLSTATLRIMRDQVAEIRAIAEGRSDG